MTDGRWMVRDLGFWEGDLSWSGKQQVPVKTMKGERFGWRKASEHQDREAQGRPVEEARADGEPVIHPEYGRRGHLNSEMYCWTESLGAGACAQKLRPPSLCVPGTHSTSFSAGTDATPARQHCSFSLCH